MTSLLKKAIVARAMVKCRQNIDVPLLSACFALCSITTNAAIFDWDAAYGVWPAPPTGQPTGTTPVTVGYDIDSTLNGTNPDVQITLSIIGGTAPTWSTDAPNIAPAVNTRLSGGAPAGTVKSLFISVDDQASATTASIKLTVDFLATSYPNGITAATFKIFDVDAGIVGSNDFIDRIFNIQGRRLNNTVVAPTSLVTSADNAVFSQNEVRGTGATGGGGGANNDLLSTGNVDINFATGTVVNQISFEWSNPRVSGATTGVQRIGFNDFSFQAATPEVHPGYMSAAACLLAMGFRRFRSPLLT